MSQFKDPYCCWICGNELDLTTCNRDEYGAGVHEDCYLVKVALATESMRPIIDNRSCWKHLNDEF